MLETSRGLSLPRAVLRLALVASLAACAMKPRAVQLPSAWTGFRPTTPLPTFATLLGTPCEDDWGWRPLHVRCGLGHRISIVVFSDWDAVIGGCAMGYRDELKTFEYPPLPLAVAQRPSDFIDEIVLYVDGPYLWLKLDLRFPAARLVIVDRRLVSAADRAWLTEVLPLLPSEDLNNDAVLPHAILRNGGRILRRARHLECESSSPSPTESDSGVD